MTEILSVHFESLVNEIGDYSPNASDKLKQMYGEHGQKLAFYAAFIVVCLRAKYENDRFTSYKRLTWEDFRDYAFFEEAQDNPHALAKLDEILAAFQDDVVAIS